MRELTYLPWHEEPHWTADAILGKDNVYYRFQANWNSRDESWHVTIKRDEEIIIQGVKLVLESDLLATANSEGAPDCMLIAIGENDYVERIDFTNISEGDVKLYHILINDRDEEL